MLIGRYIIKKYRVTIEKNKSADIITSALHISLNGNLQSKEEYKPIYWEINLSISVIQKKMEQILEDS